MSFDENGFRKYLFDNNIGNPRNYCYYLDCIEKWFAVSVDDELKKDRTESLYNRIQAMRKTPEKIGKKEIDLRNAASKLNRYVKYKDWLSVSSQKEAVIEKKVPVKFVSGENEVVSVLRHIADSDEKCATDVMYALTLLETNVDNMLESIKIQLFDVIANNKFDEINKLTAFCNNITKLNNQINLCIDALLKGSYNAKKVISNPGCVPTKIDYSLYQVDNTKIHLLNEDFTHKKICSFKFEDKDYKVESWKDALNKLCSLLYKKNAALLKSFVNDDDFINRIHYFSEEYIPERNEKIAGTDIYVAVNLPANVIVQLIKKLLNKYHISFNEFGILLRADYSDLHKQ